jgi:hypothetical protein
MNISRVVLVGIALAVSQSQASFASSSEGCTPGYWKNHLERWDGIDDDDFTHTVRYHQSFNVVFGVSTPQSGRSESDTLRDAVRTGGGGLRALNRHAAAALASADSVDYPLSVGQVIDIYRDAVGAIPGPATINSAHALFECYNERHCPLSNCTPPPPPRYFCVADQSDCACGADSLLAGCVNSTGLGARLEAEGSSRIGADDLRLLLTQLPPNSTALMLMAQQTSRVAWGDGLLCIGGLSKIFRLPPALNTGEHGTATSGPGLVALSLTPLVPVPGGIQAGDTWNFQAYFRDVLGCGSGFNSSNGVSITFRL